MVFLYDSGSFISILKSIYYIYEWTIKCSRILGTIYTNINNYIFIDNIWFKLCKLLFTIFNHIVKYLIKQPRPKRPRYLYDFEKDKKNGVYTGAQTYGMPSGHAQSSFYSMFTVLFTVPNNYIKLGSILIACNTYWQRWVYRNHTIIQILIG